MIIFIKMNWHTRAARRNQKAPRNPWAWNNRGLFSCGSSFCRDGKILCHKLGKGIPSAGVPRGRGMHVAGSCTCFWRSSVCLVLRIQYTDRHPRISRHSGRDLDHGQTFLSIVQRGPEIGTSLFVACDVSALDGLLELTLHPERCCYYCCCSRYWKRWFQMGSGLFDQLCLLEMPKHCGLTLSSGSLSWSWLWLLSSLCSGSKMLLRRSSSVCLTASTGSLESTAMNPLLMIMASLFCRSMNRDSVICRHSIPTLMSTLKNYFWISNFFIFFILILHAFFFFFY